MGEFGTSFIGSCRTPRVTEQMIENMFVGRPPGNGAGALTMPPRPQLITNGPPEFPA